MKKSPKTRLKEIELEIPRLKQEAGAAQLLVSQAEGERYALEREIKRAQKPTPPMMVLLKDLEAGGAIKRNRYQSESYYRETHDGHTTHIRSSLFYGLRDREVIEHGTDSDIYRITSHGRKVLEKWA